MKTDTQLLNLFLLRVKYYDLTSEEVTLFTKVADIIMIQERKLAKIGKSK